MIWTNPEDKNYRGACIYMFTSPSRRHYVGQTVHKCRRMNSHRTDHLRKKNGKWYVGGAWGNALRKYGIKNMKVRILQKIRTDANTHKALNKAEREWILIYRTHIRTLGYNSDTGGKKPKKSPESVEKSAAWHRGKRRKGQALVNLRASAKLRRGVKKSPEACANMSAAYLRPEVIAKKRRTNCKPVIATDVNGDEIEYFSATEASRVLNLRRESICSACVGKYPRKKNGHHTYKGLTWRYKK